MAKYVQPTHIVDSSASFLKNTAFDSSVFLKGSTYITSPVTTGVTTPYALVVDTIGDRVLIKYSQLGTMAGKQSADYDASISKLISKDASLDASIGTIWTKLGYVDTSLSNLGTKNANQDASINNLDILTQKHDVSIGLLLASSVKSWNGLTTTDNSVGLGGSLNFTTTITTAADKALKIAGLVTSTAGTPSAIVMEGIDGSLRIRTLGTMAWETSTNYYSKTSIDNLLNPFATNASVNSALNAYATNSSVNTALNAYATNASINTAAFAKNASFGLYATNASVNTALGAYTTNVSVNTALNAYATNASINTAAFAKNASFGLYATNSSVNTALGAYATNASISTAAFAKNASLSLYVQKAGDTMTGPLTISGGGLSINNDVSITGGLYVNTNATVKGNLTINGSLYVIGVEEIDVSAAYIHLNTGLTGAPPSSLQSGIIVNRGTAEPYVFLFDESHQEFRIGIANETSTGFLDASTQAVATREDTPTAFGIEFWNGSKYRFDTSVGFTFTPGVGLGLPIATNQGTETTVLSLSGGTVGSVELGTMAFETSSNYYSKTQNDVLLGYRDTSITNLDKLTQIHTSGIADLSTNAIRAVANVANGGTASIFSYELNNTAYLKKLVQGTGATITEDTSTITISVAGVAGYVSKYVGSFHPDGSITYTIPTATHGLGAGPFSIAVYELRELVYPGISYASNGDITIDWTAGSLTGDCSIFIAG